MTPGTLHTDEEPTDHALTPPTKFDRSAATETIYCPHPVQGSFMCSAPVVPSIFRYGAEGGSPVAWEKTNPHRYRSVGSVRSCHPPRGAKFDSKAKEGDRLRHNKSVTAQYAPPDLSVEAQHRQNEESVKERTIEPLEDPTHKEAVTPTDVDYSQQEENRHERDLDPLGPGTEENIASPVSGENIQKSGSPIVDVTSDTGAPVDADERYDSCREDQLSEPEEDSKFGAGKRQRKRSRKLTGVYEARRHQSTLYDSFTPLRFRPRRHQSTLYDSFKTQPVYKFKILFCIQRNK
ncbi:hypothetical protein Bca52824_027848 [Brassica carinata]|uniref:Uncharacterized protein n=1 Tax=Brassica carinata TaxID=52824 RepID=A0A8X7VBD7_BRACI|nr:hypothetical protein Bca52824_027848 [Brassica carinata]